MIFGAVSQHAVAEVLDYLPPVTYLSASRNTNQLSSFFFKRRDDYIIPILILLLILRSVN